MHCAKCFFYESNVGDDICNRCGRAYLPEANVYLGLLILVTGGLAWTLRHLLTGDPDPFVRPAVDLGAWGAWPISIVDRPAYGLVLGGWLGMLAAVPVLTGVMYGKRGGWLVTILIALLGPSLGLAAAAAVGVWIAAGHTVRLSSKLAGALLGLVPPVLYLFVATALTDFSRGEADPSAPAAMAVLAAAGRTLPPALRGLIYVPPATAAVVAAAAVAMVVGIGAADRWHIRWPASLLTVLTAGPVLALLAFVGVDEVRYGMTLAPASPLVAWAGAGATETDRLRAFLGHHPNSPRAGQVRSRLAVRLAHRPPGEDAEPHTAEALALWDEVFRRRPDSPYAVEALLNLGDADAQDGLFEKAETRWRAALARAAAFEPPAEDPLADFSVFWDAFTVGRRLRARDEAEHLAGLRQAVLVRMATLAENRADTQESRRALALYFRAMTLKGSNPHRQALLAAQEADPQGPLADNIAYDLALLEPYDAKRIEHLSTVAEQWPDRDGAMLADIRAAQNLVGRAGADPGALRAARAHLLRAQNSLSARKRRDPGDPYVAAFGDRVEKELVYVQAQLRTPASEG